ncbi:tyrosyl-tRNA synthetase [Terribacillus halophilus]|uniref:Tyrosine--tRNA ligase n=1 Tax=Terribacillus halophilus TaxID=361279 RepID=A0A1G6U9U4_9BACI|nr:tyrosine--tRNA ligase [Terribacillus halophilus]SDD38059.1 tyrosyl-tRNA synthetase [Terribacillus halophilus]
MSILQDLKDRGLIQQTSDDAGLEKHLSSQQVSLYCGFDPTADSLHIGHLVPMLMLKRFQQAGHRPIALIGGGTGMIGDPSGRSDERNLNDAATVERFSQGIQKQLAKILNFDEGENAAKAVNNKDWLGSMSIIDFLRDIGKHFGVNYMLAKDSVESRLANGISFTEFTYMILQSLDYLRLHEKENVTLQIGGSDQWGNITAGMELIRRTYAGNDEEAPDKAFALTVPLITKADGTKFGKTAGGAVWLSPERTTPYEFYQFWFNTDDRDVIKFMKYFTFMSLEEIATYEESVEKEPEKRLAQTKLAEEMTTLVHGNEALEQAIKISEALFSGDIASLNGAEIEQGFKDVPSHTAVDEDKPLVDMLVEAGISPSKRQAREDITNGAIRINGEKEGDVSRVLTKTDRIDGRFIIIRRGKKKYTLVKFA